MASPRIFGFGLGLVLLALVWACCLLWCLVSTRKRGIQFGFIYPLLGCLVTIGALIWPREPCGVAGGGRAVPEESEDELVGRMLASATEHQPALPVDAIDWLAIPRLLFALLLLGMFSLALLHLSREQLFRPAAPPPSHHPEATGGG